MMKKVLIILLLFGFKSNAQTRTVQDFVKLPNDKWQRSGQPHEVPDTLTTIHAYYWKKERIIEMQDFKKINGKWEKYGERYAVPDTLKLVHAILKP